MWFRLEGPTRALIEASPESLGPVYLVLTDLADVTFLILLLTVLYLVGWRREAATVIGYGFLGYVSVIALKIVFALPRPPETWWLYAFEGYATASAGSGNLYGFPSGHAVAAVVIYGGLAVERGWLDDRRKLAAVAGLIVVISMTRIPLGLHYLGDTIGGLALGVGLIAGARWIAEGDPRRTFAVATPVAAATVLLTGFGASALAALGACIGGILAGRIYEIAPEPRSRVELGALLVVGLGFVVAIQLVEPLFAGILAAVVLVDLVLVAGILGTPLAVAWALEAASVEEPTTA